MGIRVLRASTFLLASCAWASAHAELSPEDLAKIAQNPVGNLISVPFQENAYFNVGPGTFIADRGYDVNGRSITAVLPLRKR